MLFVKKKKKQSPAIFENFADQNITKRVFEKMCILRVKIMKDFPEYQMDSDVSHGPDKRTIVETLV